MSSFATPPVIECDQVHAGLAMKNLARALEFYTSKLGFVTAFTWGDPPSFAGVNLGQAQIFLSQGPPAPSKTSANAYFMVDDADLLYQYHRSNGVEIAQEIGDREYGIRDYAVRDLYGYFLVFGHRLHNAGPPLRVKRVELKLRLEKRLAALLKDLARHKRMTLGECLEEMILHTNEGVGPHTRSTLRFIDGLKRKHRIDYDCHASYRFTEDQSGRMKR